MILTLKKRLTSRLRRWLTDLDLAVQPPAPVVAGKFVPLHVLLVASAPPGPPNSQHAPDVEQRTGLTSDLIPSFSFLLHDPCFFTPLVCHGRIIGHVNVNSASPQRPPPRRRFIGWDAIRRLALPPAQPQHLMIVANCRRQALVTIVTQFNVLKRQPGESRKRPSSRSQQQHQMHAHWVRHDRWMP